MCPWKVDTLQHTTNQIAHLVNLKRNPANTVTERGIRLQHETEHEPDILVYATGFNGII